MGKKPDFYQIPLLFSLARDHLKTKNFDESVIDKIFDEMTNDLLAGTSNQTKSSEIIETHHIELESDNSKKNLYHADTIQDLSPELYTLLEDNKTSCIILTAGKGLLDAIQKQLINTPELSKMFIMFNTNFDMSTNALIQIFKNTFFC